MTRLLSAFFSSSPKQFLFCVILVALGARLGVVAFAGDTLDSKFYEYGTIAESLVRGHGFAMHWFYHSSDPARIAVQERPPEFEGAYMPPLNTWIVGLAFLVSGIRTAESALVLMLLYAAIGSLTPLAVWFATRSFATERAARLATAGIAMFPPAIVSVTTFSGSVLFQTGALFVMMLAIVASRSGTALRFVLLGLACGAMVLLRSEFLALGLLMIASATVLATLGSSVGNRSAAPAGALGAVAMLLVVAPWTVRNFVVFDAVVPVISHPWSEIWRGNNPYALPSSYDDSGESNWFNKPHYNPLARRLDSLPYDQHFELAADSLFRREVLDYIAEQPGRAVGIALQRIIMLWSVDMNHPVARNPVYIALIIPTILLIVTGFAISFNRARRSREWGATVLYGVFFLFTSATVAITHLQPRHQVYLVVVAFPFIGVALERIIFRPR